MKTLAMFSLLAGVAAFPVFADCVAPPMAPALPDGATASRDDLLAAKNAVKAYDGVVKNYLDCMEKSHGSAAKQEQALRVLREVADRFNTELRKFKEKNSA